MFAKWRSLFPGIGFGFGYKVTQRIYKFGGQPIVNDLIKHRFGDEFKQRFGSFGPAIISGLAGAVMGVGEIVLLPLDVLKIKAQTNPEALAGRGLIRLVREEGIASFYRGAGWTAARNAPGSFALFGAAASTKHVRFSLQWFFHKIFYLIALKFLFPNKHFVSSHDDTLPVHVRLVAHCGCYFPARHGLQRGRLVDIAGGFIAAGRHQDSNSVSLFQLERNGFDYRPQSDSR
jgi:hypothetical protein